MSVGRQEATVASGTPLSSMLP